MAFFFDRQLYFGLADGYLPRARYSRMPSKGRNRQELTWSWAYSTGHPASDQRLEAAAKAAWPHAAVCAWTYLNDRDAAYDLMDHAIQNASGYIARHPEAPTDKLTSRIKSVLQRRAKQLAAKRSRELAYGSLLDLEHIHAGKPEAEQRVYANELFDRLSPFAQSIVNWRWLGYSWREIAGQLEMDHTAVRRAYFRELDSVLRSLPDLEISSS
jgi:DNA-binding NarL/FixJ family response regulator